MNAENVEEILEDHLDQAIQSFNEGDAEDEDRLVAMIRDLQQRAYAYGFERGVVSDADVIDVAVDQEGGWNLARNLMYGAPIVLRITR